LSLVAIRIDVLDLNQIASAKTIRPTLLGPGRSSGSSARQRVIAAPRPDAVTPAPAANEPLGYEIFEAPGILVNVTSTSQGPAANTVEYIGHDAGEPSVGVNWQSTQDSVKGMTAY